MSDVAEDSHSVSAWDERALYWPPPFKPREVSGFTLRRSDAGHVYWRWEGPPGTVEVATAVRQDPKRAVARLREAAAAKDALNTEAARLEAAWKELQGRASKAREAASDALDDLLSAEATVFAFIRTGELP